MVASFALALLLQGRVIDDINALAQARNVDGFSQYVAGDVKAQDFSFLKGAGAYGVGRFPWSALELNAPSGRTFVVFSTRVTSQDMGEQLFLLEGGKITKKIQEDEILGHHLTHCDFDIRFAPAESRVLLKATATANRLAGVDADLVFRLSNNYHVKSVTDSRGAALEYKQAGGVIAVKAPAENKYSINMEYEAVLGKPGFAGSASESEFMLTEDYWWPVVGRKPMTFTAKIHTPSDWFAVTNGDASAPREEAGGKLYEYKMSIPICYLSLTAGKMEVRRSAPQKGISYWVASPVMPAEDMNKQLRYMPPIIEFYSRYKPYPFESFGSLVSDLYVGGALEAYSYATYGTGWLPDEDPHEPAHTWFGGIIPNTYLKSFWNESFAEYMSGLYRREGSIGSQADKRLAFVDRPSPSPAWNQTSCEDSGASKGGVASTLGYGKGSFVLQQLEYEMGTPAMNSNIIAWLDKWPSGQEAEWSDFEKVCGTEWKWFFDQWIRRAGFPDLEFQNVQKVGGKITGNAVFKGDPYRMKVQVLVRDASGDTLTSVTILPAPGSQLARFEIPCLAGATLVSFDPYGRLPLKHPGQRPATAGIGFRAQGLVDPAHADWAPEGLRKAADEKRAGKVIVGHPDTFPAIRDLVKLAGFAVKGDTLTYRGKSYSLKSHVAAAVVNLPEGGTATIRLGKGEQPPSTGTAQVAVCDSLGRFLAGETAPITAGGFAFKL